MPYIMLMMREEAKSETEVDDKLVRNNRKPAGILPAY